MTLVEVLTAMVIFAIISVGLASAMVTSLRMTDNARHRVAATNLASEAVDTARASTNLLALVTNTTHPVVDGTNFHVKTAALWLGSESGATGQCSAGGGTLQHKQINVSVTWDGMLAPGNPVRSDTLVAPSSRVNDPEKGVIVASVRTASGAPSVGVKVAAVPKSPDPAGAVAIPATPVTDAQGCAYFLNVVPGNYVVSVSMAGAVPAYVSDTQELLPKAAVKVTKGSSGTAPFQFDQAHKYSLNYATNFTSAPVVFPETLDKTFVNSYGIFTSTAAGPFTLHPFGAGYTFVAGKLAANGSTASGCQSVDPGAWLPTTVGSETFAGIRHPEAAPAPGKSLTVNVPMGVAQVKGPGGAKIKAVAQFTGPVGSGDPGCEEPSTYRFTLPTSGSANLALPFGSWVLTSGNATAQTAVIPATSIVPLTRGAVSTTMPSGPIILTMDPRELVVAP